MAKLDALTRFSSFLENDDIDLCLEANRLKTFTRRWPHNNKNSKLTPENMARAGFYSVQHGKSRDNVRCFCCFKELEGWESGDDPWVEHRNEACEFLKIGKSEEDLTVGDFLMILKCRYITLTKRLHAENMEAFNGAVAIARKKLQKIQPM